MGIAGWYGFDATMVVHSDHSIVGITLAIVWLPLVFASLGLIATCLLPINEGRHKTIWRYLDRRAAQGKHKDIAPALPKVSLRSLEVCS